MSIKYLCVDCAKALGLRGFGAVNLVGRKNCEGCGTNEDSLIVVDELDLDQKIKKCDRDRVLETIELEVAEDPALEDIDEDEDSFVVTDEDRLMYAAINPNQPWYMCPNCSEGPLLPSFKYCPFCSVELTFNLGES